jgi:hypothetical protein
VGPGTKLESGADPSDLADSTDLAYSIDAPWQMGQVLEDVYMQKRIHIVLQKIGQALESLRKPPESILPESLTSWTRNRTHAAIISKHAAISGDNSILFG